MVHICVMMFKQNGVTYAKASLDKSTYEFVANATGPILEYEMIEGVLVRKRDGTLPTEDAKRPKPGGLSDSTLRPYNMDTPPLIRTFSTMQLQSAK
ncbi:unnamed protein product [Caenorhabditis nigoni]|uniref:Uncharacterized protein n=1 Tax=Caenorhabditis nigoni TaxID=1611254 RepID=A0A2G5SAI3_9PELO|nr:hypothetical protein B9Z55_028758 [Caenorhabditis nigoni]